MTSNLERDQALWLQGLEYQCKINTLNYWGIRDLIRYRRIEGLAAKFLAFMHVKGWTDIGVFSQTASKRRIVHFQSFSDWLSSDYSDGGLAIAPLPLILLLSNSVEYERSLDVCLEVVRNFSREILVSTRDSLIDISVGMSCLHGDQWSSLEQLLSQLISAPDLMLETTIVGENVVTPRYGSTQKVLDRIQRVLSDPEQIKRRELSAAALREAYTLLVQGMATPNQALRIAGLVQSSHRPSRSVYLVKDSSETASRIVNSLGRDKAIEVAKQILDAS